MGTKAYLMVNLEKRYSDDGYVEAMRELATIPEVESVEPVSGICDLVVKVDAPTRVVLVANKILPLKWVKNLRILRIEPSEADTNEDAGKTRQGKTSTTDSLIGSIIWPKG